MDATFCTSNAIICCCCRKEALEVTFGQKRMYYRCSTYWLENTGENNMNINQHATTPYLQKRRVSIFITMWRTGHVIEVCHVQYWLSLASLCMPCCVQVGVPGSRELQICFYSWNSFNTNTHRQHKLFAQGITA